MPTLDDCISGTFEPGNIGASSGQTPVAPEVPPAVPTITSSDTVSVAENVQLAFELEADKYVAWTIIGGVDAAQFEISTAGFLTWVGDGTQDFETPLDDDIDNDYVVQVRATDVFGNTDEQTITVTVTDVTEGVFLLKEDGDYLLLETGDKIVQE